MLKRSPSRLSWMLICVLLALATGSTCSDAHAEGCPTNSDPIATDRPDVTNSSLVVPTGSLQAENGIDWTVRHGSDELGGTNTRLRLGFAHCTEFVLDVPDYVWAFNGPETSGFSNVVVSFKRQLPVPLGFDLSATAGLGFPSGSPKIAGRGYQPYIQFPWSHPIVQNWEVVGMFTVTWFPDDSARNPTFQPTLSLEREFGPLGDLFVEYVGEFNHQRPSHLLDGGGAWRFTKRQQLDFHAGFGLNSSSVDHYFGIGYSLRLDSLFAKHGNQP
jgi:hypothetical protein